MASRIKVNVDVNSESITFATDKVLTLQQQVRALKQALQIVPEGTAEWKVLQQKFNETRDSLERVTVKSKELFGTLGALPGPIGDVSSKLNETVDTLKLFSEMKVSDISNQFSQMGKVFVNIGKGLLDLTGITKLYEVTVGLTTEGLIAMGIAEDEAAIAAKGLSGALIATGVGALIVALGLLIANWDKVTDSITGATEESKTYEAAQKEVTKSVSDFDKKLFDVKDALKGAAEGTVKKEDALKKYNDTLGATLGYAGTLKEAEDLITANTPVYIKSLQLRTQAQVFYGKAAEASAKLVSGEGLEEGFWQGAFDLVTHLGDATSVSIDKVKEFHDTNTKISKDLTLEADKLTNEAIENDKLLKKGLAVPPDFAAQKAALIAARKNLEDYAQKGKDALQELNIDLSSGANGAREKELQTLTEDYNKRLKEVKKYHLDKQKLDLSFAQQTAAINKKYADTAAKAIKDYILSVENTSGEARQKELGDAKIQYDKLYNDKAATEEDKLALTAAYVEKQAQINKKYNETDLKAQRDFANKVLEIHAAAIKDDTDLKIAQRDAKYTKDLEDLEADKLFIARSEEEKAQIRLDLSTARDNDIAKIKLDKKVKDNQDELDLLTAQQKTLTEGTQAYLDNSLAIEAAAYEIKLANAKDNAIKIESVEIEHAANIKSIQLKAAIAEKQIQLDRLSVISGIAGSLAQLAGKNKALAIAAVAIDKAAAVGSIIVNTQIANLKAVAASPLTFGQPWVTINTIAGALAAAAAIASGIQAIQQINAVQIPGAGSTGATPGGGGASPTMPQEAAAVAQAPNIGTSAVSSEGKLGAIITGAATEQNTRPLQTYVVGTQVSSQQQLDRRVALSARMGG
jgi:hypothetical protein